MNEFGWTLVAQVPLSQNLDKFTRQLQSRGIVHKVVADEQRQSVWVENPEHISLVDQLLREAKPRATGNPWVDQPPARPRKTRPGNKASYNNGIKLGGITQLFSRFPVVMWGLVLSTVGALLARWMPDVAELFLFPPLPDSLWQVWRLVTPIFLHFSLSHWLFNGLWLWVFGSRLEHVCGSWGLLWIVLITGMAGNFGEYLWSHSIRFGGMSGVVFGLMGYIWVRQIYNPHPLLAFPPMLFGIMLLFLLLGMTGAVGALVGSGIANAAHLGGLLAGMGMGWQASRTGRSKR